MRSLTLLAITLGICVSQPPPPNMFTPWTLGGNLGGIPNLLNNPMMSPYSSLPKPRVQPDYFRSRSRLRGGFEREESPELEVVQRRPPARSSKRIPPYKTKHVEMNVNIYEPDNSYDQFEEIPVPVLPPPIPAQHRDPPFRGEKLRQWKPVRLWEERTYEKVEECCDFVLTDIREVNTSVLVPFNRALEPPTRWPVFKFFTPNKHEAQAAQRYVQLLDPVATSRPLHLYRIIDYRWGLPNADPKYRPVRLALIDRGREALVDADNLSPLFIIGEPDDNLESNGYLFQTHRT